MSLAAMMTPPETKSAANFCKIGGWSPGTSATSQGATTKETNASWPHSPAA